MKKYLPAALIIAATCHSVFSQEQLGIRLDNYSGINATVLNPAASASCPFTWDINLVEGAQFISNNYVYLTPVRLNDLLHDPENMEFAFGPDYDPEKPLPQGTMMVDFFTNNRPKYANIMTSIMGPSFYVRLNEQHTLGLLTRARFLGSANTVTSNLAYYQYDGRPFFQDFTVNPFHMGMMAWSEVALNYSYTMPLDNGNLSIGATAKWLQGYEAIYLHNATAFTMSKLPGDSLAGSPIDFSFGFTDGNLYADPVKPQRNGNGWGLDLGVVFTQGDESGYNWKFSAALLDIGLISFKRHAQQHHVLTNTSVEIDTKGYNQFDGKEDLEGAIQLFSDQLLLDSAASLQGSQFGMWLPSALSVQADRRLLPSIYLNAALVQGFPLGKAVVQRGSLLALTPRYETRWWGASLPVSFYNWQHLRVGLALRLAFFTIGTDHLGSIVQQKDFYGTDVYFAIKINPFQFTPKEDHWKPRKTHSHHRRGPSVRCYEF